MQFKRIYIEITNVCNLSCPFCPPTSRKKDFMSIQNFQTILNKIKPFTKYIYLHVKGEPTIHPNFKEFVKLAFDEGFFVNITTNGTLVENIYDVTKYIRQLNISLQDTNSAKIIEKSIKIQDCFVNFRIWNLQNNHSKETITLLEKNLNTPIMEKLEEKISKEKKIDDMINFTIKENYFISVQNEFKWPNLADEANLDMKGYCRALKDHIAILVDGTVVPCCLDNNGDINLGNIFNEDLGTILSSEHALNILNGFKNRILVEPLCQKCEYRNRFKE